jgi:cell division protein FtsN/nucleoid DNA-binding protein
MIIGKYIRSLLEDRTRVILPGFGNLEVILSEGTKAPSGKRIDPPGLSVKFDTGFSKDDGILAEAMAAGEVMEREEAEQKVLELVDAIKFSLDKGEDFMLPEAGTFSRDADGKTYFRADPTWVLEPEQYGLEPMELLELEDLTEEEEKTITTKTDSKSSTQVTELAPPKPKPKSYKWRLIWLVAAVLIVVLVVLVLIPSGETEDSERRKLFNRKADQEEVDQAGESDGQDQLKTEEQTVVPETEEVETEAEEEQIQPVEESDKFFIIAGSFSKLKNASDLQDQLNSRGYNAEVMITENRMYRVSVASYASKEEAENALSQLKSEPGLQSCWLLSN